MTAVNSERRGEGALLLEAAQELARRAGSVALRHFRSTLTVEASGGPEKLEALRELLSEFGIVELSRTGRIALARGERGIRERVLKSAKAG